MSARETRVLAAVIRRGGRVLICRRAPEKRHGGLWEFPGGKVEAGESDHAAISRELAEELDLKVLSTGRELAAFPDPGSHFRIVFLEVDAGGDPAAREHSEIAWVPHDRLRTYSLAPTDRRFVEEELL